MTEMLKSEMEPKITDMNSVKDIQDRILAAVGTIKPDLILKNTTFINVFTNELEIGDIVIHKGYIVSIGNFSDRLSEKVIDCTGKIICPGFIDGHIHIESSMLAPAEFALAVLPRGTTTIITDPHEIANVLGIEGIDYMLQSTKGIPLDVFFMLPSCVPATALDESGAVLEAEDLAKYYNDDRVLGLAELMNSYGTIHGDEGIVNKLALTKVHNKLVDGHAPGLQGSDLNGYITAGVTSDHECSSAEDAITKLKRGQWIMIREGTAAQNMDALMPLFQEPYCNRCMLVTDDKHPGDLIQLGHMDYMIRKAIKNGADPIRAIKMATKHPAEYFGLKNTGAVAPGYKADLVVLDNLENINVEAVYKAGEIVAHNGRMATTIGNADQYDTNKDNVYHSFHMKELSPVDFKIKDKGNLVRIIELLPGEILTRELILPYAESAVDENQDIIKLAVVERHHNTGHIGIGFMKGYGLKNGAVASSISHDSHNLIIAGTNDEDMCLAANCVRENQGGIAVVANGKIVGNLALPIAGLMCDESAENVEAIMTFMKQEARKLGVSEKIDPFMTLAFISLPVIPEIRLTTLGLVDAVKQQRIKVII